MPVFASHLFCSALFVSLLNLFARILGFIRDLLVARLLGSSPAAEAFVVASLFPNLIRRLLGEGAFAQALIPVLAQTTQSQQQASLINQLFTRLGVIAVGITLLMLAIAPLLADLLAPGFLNDSPQRALTIQLLFIVLPSGILIALTALMAAVLNYYQCFTWVALLPGLPNFMLIVLAMWLAPQLENPVFALAGGLLAGSVLQLALQGYLWRHLHLPPLQWQWRRPITALQPLLTSFWRRLGPILLSASIPQLSLLISTSLASTLLPGSIAWLYYADRLMQFPLGLLAGGLATVILPRLAQDYQSATVANPGATLEWALRWAFLLALPATCGLGLLAYPIVVALFQYGDFSPQDAAMTSVSLQAYASGIPAWILIKLLLPAFYARHQVRWPTRMAFYAVSFNLIGGILFLPYLAHTGLALATALAAWLNALGLFWGVQQGRFCTWQPGWFRFMLRLLAANLSMVILLITIAPLPADWLAWSGYERIRQLIFLITLAMSLYGISLAVFGLKLRHFTVKTQ